MITRNLQEVELYDLKKSRNFKKKKILINRILEDFKNDKNDFIGLSVGVGVDREEDVFKESDITQKYE